MMPAMHTVCDACGAELAPDAPSGLCPACVFQLGDTVAAKPLCNANESPGVIDIAGLRFGDYELLEEIARGGMGIVYRARQLSLDRFVALKMILFGSMANAEQVRRFRIEAAAAGSLQHPNIVAVHEVGLHQGQHFMAMDFVDGPNLARLAQDRPFSPREAAHCIQTVAGAVHFAHERGILHRDLKPSNVLVGSDGRPRVTDFGLAKRFEAESSLTLSAQVVGSPNYLPPEQAGGGRARVGRASDIYSLGAILFHLVTGRPPFRADTIAETLAQVQRTEPLAPRLLNASVPGDLDTICLKCLQKDPLKRYPTAQALADDLGRFLENEPIQARPVTRVERAWRWCQRRPAFAASLLAIVVLLTVVLSGLPVALYQINHARQLEAVARRNAEAQLYTSDVNLAKQEWEAGNLLQARALLRAHIPARAEAPDLRGFEWRYLWRLCQDESLHTVKLDLPAGATVKLLRTSPAHAFVAAHCGKAILLLDPATGGETDRFLFPNPDSVDGRPRLALAARATHLLAAQRADGLVAIWNVTERKLLATVRAFPSNVEALGLSPDGRLLATASMNYLKVWDLPPPGQSPQLRWETTANAGIQAVEFSPDGEHVIAAKQHGKADCAIWEARSGQLLSTLPSMMSGYVGAMAIAPDASLLAISGIDGRIHVYDYQSRSAKFALTGHGGGVQSLMFSEDSRRLISAAADATIRVWDLPSQSAAGIWRTTNGLGVNAVFAPGGRGILSAQGGEAKLWAAEPSAPADIIDVKNAWGSALISPNSRWLVVTDGIIREARSNGATVWDLRTRNPRFRLTSTKQEPSSLVFSPDGRWLAMGDIDHEGVLLYDTAQWDVTGADTPPLKELFTGFEAGSLAFSPDGKILAVAGVSFHPSRPSHVTNRLTFFAVGSWEKLDLLPGAGAGTTEREAAASVAFSNNGRYLAVGYRDGWARLWDLHNQRLIRDLGRHEDVPFGVLVRFSKDDRWLISFSINGSTVKLFDATDPMHVRETKTFQPSATVTWSAGFTPDSKSLVTHSNDGLIKFWSLQTLNSSLTLRHGFGPGGFVQLTEDGELLSSLDANGILKLWQATPESEMPRFNDPLQRGGTR